MEQYGYTIDTRKEIDMKVTFEEVVDFLKKFEKKFISHPDFPAIFYSPSLRMFPAGLTECSTHPLPALRSVSD